MTRQPLRTPFNIRVVLPGALLVLTVLIAAFPRMAPGICYDDAGDLQLAAATLGITHPPGYPIYVTLAWPVTLIPHVDPAYAVTVFCLFMGCAALTLGYLIQIELGVNGWLAAAVMLALAGHPRTWWNLLAAEVYIISLAFIGASIYLLVRYSLRGRKGELYLAALLFGCAAISRPPLIAALPFFIVGWWAAKRKLQPVASARGSDWRRDATREVVICGLVMCAPVLYSAGYLYVRDTPRNPHSFIEDHIVEAVELPGMNEGVSAKLERVYWQMSGKLFQSYLGDSWNGTRAKLRWMASQLFFGNAATSWASILLAVAGLLAAFRVNASAAWVLLGIALQSIAYVLEYRVHGQAADLLPLLYASGVATGCATTALPPIRARSYHELGAILLLGLAAFGMLYSSRTTPSGVRTRDATDFLKDVDMGTLLPNAVICAEWRPSMPLKYAKIIVSPRPDITIVPTGGENWLKLVGRFAGRPILIEGQHPALAKCRTTRYRSMLVLDPASCTPEE